MNSNDLHLLLRYQTASDERTPLEAMIAIRLGVTNAMHISWLHHSLPYLKLSCVYYYRPCHQAIQKF